MPLLTDLLETFDTVSGHEPEGMEKIAPVACHVSSPKQVIDVILTKDGTFVSANVQTLKSGHTLVFQTEESGGRTGGCAPHALNDGLLYMTDRLSGVKDGAFGRYKAQLGAWADDPDTPDSVRAVRDYVETHDLADDLIGHGCLSARDLPAHKKDFVRWIVTGTEGESRTWLNPDIAQSWSRYYTRIHSQREHGLDAMTGLGADIEKNHPRAVRAFVKAKLMSVPSKEPCALHCGRAFQSESQCMQIGYVTSQKIHNALTWLTDNEGIFISSQNKKTRILVLWEPHFEPAKRQDASDIEAMFGITLKGGETTYQSLRDAFRKRLLMQGGDALQGRKVSLFAIDSATPGRLSATLYRSFMMPDFLEKLDRWQNTCRWHKSGFDLSQGTRAPSLYEIASCAYGTDRDPDRPGLAVSDALFIDAVDQLLRTVLSGGSIPSAMFHRLMIQVSEPERFSSAKWNWILRTACAVYHKKETDRHPEKGDQNMELDRNNESRSYLFGRLLAVYEQVEAYAVYQKNGKGADSRSTNAMRLWNSYVNRPYAAMAVLRKAVMPYLLGLHAGSRGFFENEMQEIVTKLDTNDPKINRPLSPDYMTGYFLERAELRKPKKTGEDRTDTEENTEESEYAEKKIDFMAVVTVENANPNGDPLNGNRPRQDFENYGLITPVCIKRKLRNRLQDMGRRILVQQDDRSDDGYTNLSDRLDSVPGFDALSKDKKQTAEDAIPILCQTFEDVRAFGTVVAMKKTSIGIRGPVTIQMGKSVSPVDIESLQITKSVSNEPGEKRGSDTMGMTHVIPFGVYLIKGSINPILSEKTGLTEQDAADIKEALRTLFVNDESAARPAGSMAVYRLFWWEQDADNIHYSTRQLMDTVRIQMKDPDAVPKSIGDYDLTVTPLPDVPMEEIEGV